MVRMVGIFRGFGIRVTYGWSCRLALVLSRVGMGSKVLDGLNKDGF